jgi:4-hydroxybutyrate CoA-transferase
VQYVVTEYGTANLFGRSIAERAEAQIAIAPPKVHDELQAGARDLGYL